MYRLSLSGLPKAADKVKCLPAGDGLPFWSTLPLDAKLPMTDSPKGSIVLYTTKLGHPKHKSKQEYDFDLRDPNGQYIRGEYQPLQDPHLKSYFNNRMMKRHLIRNGFISNDGKVLCSLREFNNYRRYLRHLCFLEIANERKLQTETSKKEALQERRDSERHTHEPSATIKRNIIEDRKKKYLSSLNNILREKSARLSKRLEEIRGQMMERVDRQRDRMKKKQTEIMKYQQEAASRVPQRLKKLRFKDKMKEKLMNERELQRRLKAQAEIEDKWNQRKIIQKERLEMTEEIMKKEEEEKQKNAEKRARMAAKQRQRLDEKIERFKVEMREEKRRREERYKQRLEEKLASGDYRIWSRRKRRRRRPISQFQSTCWKLDDVLRRLTATSLLPPTQRQPSFMVKLSAAIDDAVDIVTKTDDELEAALHEKAKEIVQGVIAKVTNEVYPTYLKILEEATIDAEVSRSVRFLAEEEEIPAASVEDTEIHHYRPVSEHIVTPVASKLEIKEMEAEALEASQILTEETAAVSFVETLLLRLLDDLNGGRLTTEEIMKLALYSMQVMQSQEAEATKQDAIMEYDKDFGAPCLVSSSSSVIAKQMVDFTLGKILADIMSENISEVDLVALTRSVLGEPFEEGSESIPDNELDEFIDDALVECTLKAQDSREDSPLCDALLDDFMVTTLQNLIIDLEEEFLTKEQIEELANTVKEEVKDILPTESSPELQDIQDIQNALQFIMNQLQSGTLELQVLYQIVFAIVYSYNMLKTPPTPEFESKITRMLKDLLSIVEEQAETKHLADVDIQLVHKASEQLSKTDLDVHQIEKLSSKVLETVAKPDIICRTSTSEIARSIVEDALAKAKAELLEERANPNLISGVQNIASVIITSYEEKHISPSTNGLLLDILRFFKEDIQSIATLSEEDLRELVEILNLVDINGLSSNQLDEMARSVALVISSPLKSESSLMAEINVRESLQTVRDDLLEGSVEQDALNHMIQNLLTAYRAIKAHEELASPTLNSLASLIKTVLCHVTYKIQRGEFNAQDISELANTFKAYFKKQTTTADDEDSASVTPEIKPEELLRHLGRITEDIQKGVLNSRDANRLGRRLVECGNEIFSILSGVSSDISTPKSEEVAEGLIQDVIKALEDEIDSGLLKKEPLKEITKTIISSTSEIDSLLEQAVKFTIRGIQRDVERGINLPELPSVTSLDHSPSASTIADHFVIQTIDHITQYLKEETPSPGMVAALASSVISLISEESIENLPDEFQAVRKTIQGIIHYLRRDAINQSDAERIFCLILENYKDYVLMCRIPESIPDSLPIEDQELMNILIEETLENIRRSVAAGKLSKKQFSIPSHASEAGSSTLYGYDLVELTLENLKRYFSVRSVPGSSTIYAHDLVDQTMRDIQLDQEVMLEAGSSTMYASELVDKTLDKITRHGWKSDGGGKTLRAHDFVNLQLEDMGTGIKTDAGSTTIYASDLVNITLQNLTQSPVVSKPKDIVDFILQIVDILANELSAGAISDLSMAHFFMVISDDTSDLHLLEESAQSNLMKVRQDIAEKRHASIYIKRILESYLVPNNAVLAMFIDPSKAVETIMFSVSSEILTRFVKATLQSILVEIREGNITLPEKARSTFVLRSASSIVAENVVQEVVARIKHDIESSVQQTLTGTITKQEFERAASSLLESPQLHAARISQAEEKVSDSKHSITSSMSQEVEDVVLETIHNIVSNLRLEQSMYPQPGVEESEIQEFVLDVLQNIIADLQDKKALYELGLSKSHEKATDNETSQTALYVNEVLQSVIQDMKREKSKSLPDDEDGRKSASNLEAMILDCLDNAVSNTVVPRPNYGLEPEQEDEVKRIIAESIKHTIQSIKDDKLNEEEMKGLASVIKADEESVSPERLIELLENEIVRIEDEGLDEDTLGRISTQLATLGMETLMPEEYDNENLVSESTISATSSLVSNLVQGVLSKLTKELSSEKTSGKQESDASKLEVPSVTSSNSSTAKKDVNYNRKFSASSGNISSTSVPRKDLNHNRKVSASSGKTLYSSTDISDFSELSEISLPDNSQKEDLCVQQSINVRSIETKPQGRPVLASEITQFTKKTPVSKANDVKRDATKDVHTPTKQTHKTQDKERLKKDAKPFENVENLHKVIAKPKPPAHKFIPRKVQTENLKAEKQSPEIVKPKAEKSSREFKISTKIKSLTQAKVMTPPDRKLVAPVKLQTAHKGKRTVAPEKNNRVHETDFRTIKKGEQMQRTQREQKPEGRRSVPTSIYTSKGHGVKSFEVPKPRHSMPSASSLKLKSENKVFDSGEMAEKKTRKKSTELNGKKCTQPTESPYEIKSLCGSHKSKLTLRESVRPPGPSEVSSNENDHRNTSAVF